MLWQARAVAARIGARFRFTGTDRTDGVTLVDLLGPIDGAIRKRAPLKDILKLLEAARGPVSTRLAEAAGSQIAARGLALKILNLCLARRHLAMRSEVVLARPFGLVVDPCNVCHVACPGCVHSRLSRQRRLFDWPPGLLSRARLERLLIRYGPRATHAVFCNYGEPLLNPETPGFIRLARRYLLRTFLSTSLSVPGFDPEAYVDSGLDYMAVSIDGATGPVYRRYRRNGNLDLVLANLQRLVAARRKMGRRTPVIAWHFLAFRHNLREAGSAREAARAAGLDRFCLVPPFDVSWDDPDIQPADTPAYTEDFGYPVGEALRDNWNPGPAGLDAEAIDADFEAGWRAAPERFAVTDAPGSRTCRWLYKNMVMDAGGRILPCCAAPRPDADLVFADLEKDTGDAFNSDRYRAARLFFAERDAYEAWRSIRESTREPHCSHCTWNQLRVNVDAPQLEQYFRTAGRLCLDGATVDLLARW